MRPARRRGASHAALAGDRQNVAVVQQAVEDRRGDHGVTIFSVRMLAREAKRIGDLLAARARKEYEVARKGAPADGPFARRGGGGRSRSTRLKVQIGPDTVWWWIDMRVRCLDLAGVCGVRVE